MVSILKWNRDRTFPVPSYKEKRLRKEAHFGTCLALEKLGECARSALQVKKVKSPWWQLCASELTTNVFLRECCRRHPCVEKRRGTYKVPCNTHTHIVWPARHRKLAASCLTDWKLAKQVKHISYTIDLAKDVLKTFLIWSKVFWTHENMFHTFYLG